jgi:H+/Cl- antiporter ClcA
MGTADVVTDINTMYLIFPAIVLGVIGGLLGPLFINVNTRMAVLRGKILTKKWMKPVETWLFSFITASSFFWVPYFVGKVKSCEDMVDPLFLSDNVKYLAWCPSG